MRIKDEEFELLVKMFAENYQDFIISFFEALPEEMSFNDFTAIMISVSAYMVMENLHHIHAQIHEDDCCEEGKLEMLEILNEEIKEKYKEERTLN